MVMVRLRLRAPVAPRAGELTKPRRPTTAGKVLTSLLAETRVMVRAAVETDASTNLLATNPPTTLRAAVGAAAALVALAAVLPVVLVALGAALVEVVICLGTRSRRP